MKTGTWNTGLRTLATRHAVKLTALSAGGLQVVRLAVSLLTLPVVLEVLGQDGLGVWMLALSMASLMMVLNSGLSIALTTSIARVNGNQSNDEINHLASAATLIALAVALLSITLVLPIILIVDWENLLDLTQSPSGDDVRKMLIVLVFLAGLGIITAVPRQIMLGRMHGFVSNASDLVGVIIGTIALIACLNASAPMWTMALVFLGPPPICTFLVGLLYFNRSKITLFSWSTLRREYLSKIGADSLRMLGYQASFAISSQSDVFLTGIILGPAASAVYGIAQRVFTFPILLAFIVNQSQWPFLARLDAERRFGELRRYFLRSLFLISIAALIAGVLVYLIYNALLEIWLGKTLETDNILLLGMVFWVVVAATVNTLDSLLKARNETKFLMNAMMAMCVVNLSVTLTLLPVIGPAGAVWGTVCSYVLCLLVPYCLRLYSVLADESENTAKDV